MVGHCTPGQSDFTGNPVGPQTEQLLPVLDDDRVAVIPLVFLSPF